MNKILTITLLLVLCMVLALAAGCSQPAKTPEATPAPTIVETTVTTAAPTPVPTTLSLTPGPTQKLPDMWSIDIQVASNGEAIDPQIITTCQGGKGLNFIQQIDVRVTRSDGTVESGIIAKPLYKGKSVSVRSTTEYRDRAEVWATTPQGEKVKIFDDYVCFRCY